MLVEGVPGNRIATFLRVWPARFEPIRTSVNVDRENAGLLAHALDRVVASPDVLVLRQTEFWPRLKQGDPLATFITIVHPPHVERLDHVFVMSPPQLAMSQNTWNGALASFS
jgi:hypothetical protein